ncbi:MAG: hypothetical protein EON59_11500 [Alphaproteobacteria bacterium]|nr:MAG: hypothetical protein EON59_11500 [Alphaproteobacteria bacterium]
MNPPDPKIGEALFSASIFCVKSFFLLKNFDLQAGLETGGGGSLESPELRVNRALEPFRGE